MNIAVIGTGYVGLVTGVCFAETGNHVVCVDINEAKVAQLKAGQIPIYEPGLDLLFERNSKAGRLHFTTNLAEAMPKAEVVFLALPTPPGEDGSADLSYVLKAAQSLAPFLKSYTVIVDKSTVPVGTAELVHDKIAQLADVKLFDVVSNPEFLREGVAVDDFLKPDRVVIGTDSEKARAVMADLYSPFVRQGNPVIFMDIRSAEMTKYAANAYLAMRISFMNEMARLCEQVGANVDNIRLGIGSDSRIGKRFLFAGVGYGGSCFPKDVQALAITAEQNGYDFKILQSVMEVNAAQRAYFLNKIAQRLGDLRGKRLALWGLAFKPNTDDIREAPALYLIDNLLEMGAIIVAHDPEAMPNTAELYIDTPNLSFSDSPSEALDQADALIIVTEWNVFRHPDFAEVKSRLASPLIFDGRNLYDPLKMQEAGFEYHSIGRA